MENDSEYRQGKSKKQEDDSNKIYSIDNKYKTNFVDEKSF